jgi:hypothetical protein
MSRRFFVPFLVFGALAATPALADSKEMVVEIYRIWFQCEDAELGK